MNEKTGEVFSIAKDNQPVAGCTISKAISSGRNPIIYFSFAAGTDISAEIFPYHKLILVAEGSIEVYGDNNYVRTLAAFSHSQTGQWECAQVVALFIRKLKFLRRTL